MTEAVASVQQQSEDINKQCGAQVSFEERQQMREAEIQSLTEALSVLKTAGV